MKVLTMDRRDLLRYASASVFSVGLVGFGLCKVNETVPQATGFGFSLYGMKSLSILEAIRICAQIGYDCVELPAMVDWPGAPERLDGAARAQIREALATHKLRLTSIMENIVLVTNDTTHASNLLRLKNAALLGRELSPLSAPVIETVMGGRPDNWEAVKSTMVDRLRDWAKVGKETQVVIAIKAHVSGAAHRPEHVRRLLEQVDSPWLRGVYDFSHFQLIGLSLADTYETLKRDCVFIHIKDRSGDAKKFQFLLPGDGDTDYVEYFRMLRESKYVGDVMIEVSGQLHSRPEYDPIYSAKHCYEVIAPAFEKAKFERRSR